MQIGKRVNHMIFICVLSWKCLLEEKGTSAHLHSSAQSQPSWKQATSWPKNCTREPCEIQTREEESVGDKQALSERLSWWTICKSHLGIGPNKTHMQPCWMTAWKSHTRFPSKLGSCSSHMRFALPLCHFFPFFFFLNFVEYLLNGECMRNMGSTKTLSLKPEDYNSSWDIGDILMALNQCRLV